MEVLRSIVVKLHREKMYFSPTDYLELSHTNLPIGHIAFSARPIFWELLMKDYNKEKGELSVIVNQYDLNIQEDWSGKSPKSVISKVLFINIQWENIKGCLVYYDGEAKHKIGNISKEDIPLPVKEVKVSHKVRIRDLHINQGYVTYNKKVRWEKEPVVFNIRHVDMFSKLNYVKPYFSKIIGKKTIDVDLVIGRRDGRTVYTKTYSSDLQKINRDSLYVIKTFEIEAVKKKLRAIPGDNILQESLDISKDELVFGNIDILEKELLFSILENNNILNSQQLVFLSETMDSSQRLMITIEPQFGFIFTIKGEEMTHCIWELINSHATYVWSFPVENLSRTQIKRLEQEFAVISAHGRSYYRGYFENSHDLFLHVVNHRRQANPMVDHFGEWRIKLESLLV